MHLCISEKLTKSSIIFSTEIHIVVSKTHLLLPTNLLARQHGIKPTHVNVTLKFYANIMIGTLLFWYFKALWEQPIDSSKSFVTYQVLY